MRATATRRQRGPDPVAARPAAAAGLTRPQLKESPMRHLRPALAMLAAGTVLAACGSSARHGTASPGRGTASAGVSQPVSPRASVQLAWSHTGKFFGKTQIWYVARVSNPGDSPASVALDARALDSTGTIVGSSQETLPNIPAHSRFDYFGYWAAAVHSTPTSLGSPPRSRSARRLTHSGRPARSGPRRSRQPK